MAANGFDSTVVGRVESVNEKGVKIDGTWHNVSKFAVGVVLPQRGAVVACTLDKAGFLRCVGPADGVVPTAPPVRGGSDAPAAPSTRDRTISRLAILKAAAEFGAARPNLKSSDVLAIAASWERWVTREQETTYDLDAAGDDAAF